MAMLRAMDIFRRLALFAAIVAGVIALVRCEAAAHDQRGDANWIARGHYISPIDHANCCGVNDCAELAAGEVEETAAGYLIPALRETVPFREVFTSQDGQFWRCRKPDGSRRCFFAPPQAM